MKKQWKVLPFDEGLDKRIEVIGPNDFRMFIDYDDVDHSEVEKTLKKMISCLNNNFIGV